METKTRTDDLPHDAEGPRMLHFVGFRDDRYYNARRVFGEPDFIHQGWDLRACREIAPHDIIVFATGGADQVPRRKSFNDIEEPFPSSRFRQNSRAVKGAGACATGFRS